MLEIICALLVLLFAYTGINKILDLDLFVRQLKRQPFPDELAPSLSLFLPSLELFIAGFLIFQLTRRIALFASLVLMSAFTVYTAMVYFHVFDRVPCSCGGVIQQLGWGEHLLFNMFFVIISIGGIYLQKKMNSNGYHKHAATKVFIN